VTKTLAIKPPAGFLHRRYHRRIVVSPDSNGSEKKNWRPGSFLALCRQLKARGFHPVIVVAPKHHAVWVAMKGNEFHTPRFDTIGALCGYLYESGCIVANDSGNGHLASFLGVPAVTIYRKRNPRFHWRPDWGPSIVVCPSFTLPGSRASLWKFLISPARIVATIERLMTGIPNDG
jgi:ADP-heptose:LPS heptosyltransferase